MQSLRDARHVFYINLDHRPDRRAHIEEQLALVGLREHATRFPGMLSSLGGAVGCTLSHLTLLTRAAEQGWDHLLVLEDDTLFTDPRTFVQQTERALQAGAWDVLLLAGNNIAPCTPVPGEACVRVTACQTTTAYLVRGAYLPTLRDNVKAGLAQLLRDPVNRRQFAIDRYWFRLQAADQWWLVVPLTVTQRRDHSDIEQRTTDYGRLMLTLDPYVKFGRCG